ncbi:hypothetical protein BV898_14509 [Hypsibius exemplaris]|uniref:SEA domain-containing protein n=1 Tax=Hypsibius exemplaris TaxID=2072580 RepID=A0A9X6N929_HYPEX|nr:hypothetical protein BV898_14509 [Hypsibius exemplaris]
MGIYGMILFASQLFLAIQLGAVQSAVFGTRSFRITDSIVLAYVTGSQRDTFLSQVEVFYRNSLHVYQATNVKITFISDSEVSAGSSQHIHLVRFQITGSAQTDIDFIRVKTEVRNTIRDAHLSGITLNDWTRYETASLVDSSDTLDFGGGSGGGGGSSIGFGSGASAGASDQLDVSDSAELTYTTTAERDDLLQQILGLWGNALGSAYIAGGLQIRYIRDMALSGGRRNVFYGISGQTRRRTVPVLQLQDVVHRGFFGLRPRVTATLQTGPSKPCFLLGCLIGK